MGYSVFWSFCNRMQDHYSCPRLISFLIELEYLFNDFLKVILEIE